MWIGQELLFLAGTDSGTRYLKVERKQEVVMIPDGFNQNQCVACPTCDSDPWRNCKDMEWMEVHMSRAIAAEPFVAAW